MHLYFILIFSFFLFFFFCSFRTNLISDGNLMHNNNEEMERNGKNEKKTSRQMLRWDYIETVKIIGIVVCQATICTTKWQQHSHSPVDEHELYRLALEFFIHQEFYTET